MSVKSGLESALNRESCSNCGSYDVKKLKTKYGYNMMCLNKSCRYILFK